MALKKPLITTPKENTVKNTVTIIVLATLLAIISFPLTASAEFNQPGARLLVHAGQDFDSTFSLIGHFIPGGNLVNGLYPLSFAELKIKIGDGLKVSPTLGYDFTANEAILSLRLAPGNPDITWAWIDLEFQPASNSLYWFWQMEHQLSPKVAIGLEIESGGSFDDLRHVNNAGGINAIWNPSKNIGFDLALRASKDPVKGIGPQVFVRCHVFGTN